MPRIPYSNGLAPGVWTPNGLCTHNAKGKSVPAHARHIGRTLGTYKAARYLRARGWSIEAAVYYLATPTTPNGKR